MSAQARSASARKRKRARRAERRRRSPHKQIARSEDSERNTPSLLQKPKPKRSPGGRGKIATNGGVMEGKVGRKMKVEQGKKEQASAGHIYMSPSSGAPHGHVETWTASSDWIASS